MKKILICVLVFLMVSGSGLAAAEPSGKRLRDVWVKTASFNPSSDEKCRLTYTLTEDAQVSVMVYTSDFDLIKQVETKSAQTKGEHQVFWDGKDRDGKIVPDETYFFCIEAAFKDQTVEVYDPTTFSGGDEFDIAPVEYDPGQGLFTFTLEKPSRVLMRIGLKNGPLMNTLSGWEVKPAGTNLVYWSGFDADNQVELINHPDLVVIATAFALPESSVLTYGNQQYDYFTYQKGLKTSQKPRREEVFRAAKIAPNYYYARAEDRIPQFKVEFPQCQTPVPKVHGELLIRMTLDEASKPFLLKNRFEVILFLDGKFVCEEEEGYTPFNLTWNSKGIKPGEHYLTINVTSYLGQVGSRTVKVLVEK